MPVQKNLAHGEVIENWLFKPPNSNRFLIGEYLQASFDKFLESNLKGCIALVRGRYMPTQFSVVRRWHVVLFEGRRLADICLNISHHTHVRRWPFYSEVFKLADWFD